MCIVHPTEPWIFRNEDPYDYKFVVWNYDRLVSLIVNIPFLNKETTLLII